MGCSTSSVVAMINNSGTCTSMPVERENRTMLLWEHPNLIYYKGIEFQFTEKDRLYLIRFTLRDTARADYHSLKKIVFKDYDFSWDEPWKRILPDREMLLYGPEKGQDLYFIEFTNRKTHEKSFELFNREISATDRSEPIAVFRKNGAQPEPTGQDATPSTENTASPASKPASLAETPAAPPVIQKPGTGQAATPQTELPKPTEPEKAEKPQDLTSGQKAVGQ
jgi:hypothetical protein